MLGEFNQIRLLIVLLHMIEEPLLVGLVDTMRGSLDAAILPTGASPKQHGNGAMSRKYGTGSLL
jgi:hypothetical protein